MTKVNRLFVMLFERTEENNFKKDHRYSFSHYYVPNAKIKDFNVLIDGKGFFDLPVKNEEEAYEKMIEMSRNNDYTTGNLLHFAYFKDNYRLIAIDLSKKIKLEDPQQINFTAKLKTRIMEQQCFSSLKNQKIVLLSFYKTLRTSYKNENAKNCKFFKQF